MVVGVTIWTGYDTTESPCVNYTDEGGMVGMSEVSGECVCGEEVTVEYLPGPTVGHPGDTGD